MTCEKEYSLSVASTSPCLAVFNGIDWTHVVFFENASGSVSGGIIEVSATGGDFCDFSSGLELYGSTLYTGPELQCVATVTMSGNGTVSFAIWQNGRDEGNQILQVDDVLGPGVHVIPFTISAGVDSLLEFTQNQIFGNVVCFAAPGGCQVGEKETQNLSIVLG